MPIVCGVRFRGGGKVYYFSPDPVQDLAAGDYVIVETARGIEMGQVVMAPREVSDAKVVGQLKPLLRRASPEDLLNAQRFRAKEGEALALCKEQVARLGLPMKVVQAEYNYDGTRLTFSFTSEQRVDFRELVRELAHLFKTRIELRQIGVRDEARITGGIGKCGRLLCCATWLNDFVAVSIRMAKQQDLPLSPMEISGLCGRLLCCLAYETDHYKEVKAQFPKVGKTIDTPAGPARIVKIDVFNETAEVMLESGAVLELTADQVAGKAPITAEPRMISLSGLQHHAPGHTVGGNGHELEAEETGDELLDDAEERPEPPQRARATSQPRTAGKDVSPSDGQPRQRGGTSRSAGEQARTPRRAGQPQRADKGQAREESRPAKEQGVEGQESPRSRPHRRRARRRGQGGPAKPEAGED